MKSCFSKEMIRFRSNSEIKGRIVHIQKELDKGERPRLMATLVRLQQELEHRSKNSKT